MAKLAILKDDGTTLATQDIPASMLTVLLARYGGPATDTLAKKSGAVLRGFFGSRIPNYRQRGGEWYDFHVTRAGLTPEDASEMSLTALEAAPDATAM